MTQQSTFFQLRAILTDTERDILRIGETPDGAARVTGAVDHIDQLLAELAGPQFDTRAEESRADALHKRLEEREASRVFRLVQKNGQTARVASSPTWHAISATHAANQRKRRRRVLTIGGIALVLGLLLFVVFPWAFPGVPTVNTNIIAQRAFEGDIPGALSLAQTEQAAAPDDPVGGVWIGALQQQQGNTQAAQATWEATRAAYNDNLAFLYERSSVLAQLGQFDAAEADATALTQQTISAPQGYLLLGGINEARGQASEAIKNYEQASELAEQANVPQISVTARSRLAFLLQNPIGAPQPTP